MSGRNLMAHCPAHEDRRPSLSARIAEDGRLLMYCHAGCPFKAILSALGVERVVPEFAPRRKPAPAQPFIGWPLAGSDPDMLETEERQLGLRSGALALVGAIWSVLHRAVAAPMRDASSKVIGIRLRSGGRKWAVRGSRNGLFVHMTGRGGPVLCPEGLTDSAVLASLGYDVVGRPCAMAGIDMVVEATRGRRAVIFTHDDKAGQVGAERLRRQATGARVINMPHGCNDVRDWNPSREELEWVIR
jgi:hypothetical protein